MTLVVEDGTGLENAESYISLADANAYFIGKRLHSSAWTASIDAVKETALRQATLLIDSEFTWTGTILMTDPVQALAWPRKDAYDRYGRARNSEVPQEVKYAVCELAHYLLDQDRLVGVQGEGIRRLRVDVIEIEYKDGTTPHTFPPHVARMLNGLGESVRSRGLIRTVSLRRT